MEKTIEEVELQIEEARLLRENTESLLSESHPPHVKHAFTSLLNHIDTWEIRLRARLHMITESRAR